MLFEETPKCISSRDFFLWTGPIVTLLKTTFQPTWCLLKPNCDVSQRIDQVKLNLPVYLSGASR